MFLELAAAEASGKQGEAAAGEWTGKGAKERVWTLSTESGQR